MRAKEGGAGSTGSEGRAGVVRRIRPEAPRITNSGDAPKSLDTVLNFPNMAHLTANGKDFSLALEMTMQESKVF